MQRGEKMDGKIDNDMLLPGFRFHPTDEELLEFYLKRKIQHHPIPAELIKQVDIYKYDPCDLPKLTSAGDKEWYFFCPRERKYKNSVRPNRVTAWGFWKATGTDRPIYSTLGIKLCIGFKKSLVFYRGKAAKCMKTDWMMHEFRLVPTSDGATRITGNNIPAADSLTLCRIFKKAIPMVNMDRSFRNEDQFNSDTFSFNHETNFTSSDMQHFHRNDQISANGGATSTSRTDVASFMFHNPSHQSRNYGFISFEEQQLLQADSSHVVQEIVDVDNEEFSYNLLSAESESWK